MLKKYQKEEIARIANALKVSEGQVLEIALTTGLNAIRRDGLTLRIPKVKEDMQNPDELKKIAMEKSRLGSEAFMDWYILLNNREKNALKFVYSDLKKGAKKADALNKIGGPSQKMGQADDEAATEFRNPAFKKKREMDASYPQRDK